jgi:hypothetical protein
MGGLLGVIMPVVVPLHAGSLKLKNVLRSGTKSAKSGDTLVNYPAKEQIAHGGAVFLGI